MYIPNVDKVNIHEWKYGVFTALVLLRAYAVIKVFYYPNVQIHFCFFKWNMYLSKTVLTSVPLKKIVTCICHWLIVPLLWILWQILISYCKFIMPNALKWGMLHICTLVIYQDIPNHKYKLLSFKVEQTLQD